MLTIESIRNEFSFILAMIGETETYFGTETFPGHGNFCEVYFNTLYKGLLQEQVDIFNNFKRNYKKYLTEIEQQFSDSLSAFELSKLVDSRNSALLFDVIVISQGHPKYDMILVCGKRIKTFLFFKKNLDFRVEFKDGIIISAKRSKNTLVDND